MAERKEATMQQELALPISKGDLADFCRRWQIQELALFGSALRTDFGPDSDIDLLVTFSPEATWSLIDHMRMELELIEMLQREVDLIDRRTVEQSGNPRRRAEILKTAKIIYSSPEADRVAR